MRHKKLLKIIGVCLLITAINQKELIGSNYSDSKKVIDSLKDVGWELLYSDPDFVLQLTNEQLELAKEINYEEGMYYGYYQKGLAYNELNIFDESVNNSFEALHMLETKSLKKHQTQKIKVLKNIGLSYYKTYGFETAKEYYLQAIEIAYQINDSSEISSLQYDLGEVCLKLEKYKEAIVFYENAIDFENSLGQKRLPKIYNSLGNTYSFLKNHTLSYIYYQRALDINTEQSNTPYYLSNIGDNYFDQEIYDSAILYYGSALEMSVKNKDKEKATWIKNNLGDVYFTKKDYSQAINYFSQAIEEFDSHEIDEEFRRACKNISNAYGQIGDFKNALKFHGMYISQSEMLAEIKNNLLQQNSIYRMKEMEWQLERKAKDEKLALSRSIIFWLKMASIALVFVLLISVYKAIRYYRGIRHVKRWLATE